VPRAHCLECGDHVVIDPTGHCPEGHEVGTQGARIEGSLGSSIPHPDEPEPWVARVEVDPEVSPPPSAMPARQIRPPAAPPAPDPTVVSPAAATARTEDLLRELHSLGDFDAPAASIPTVRPTTAAATTTSASPSIPGAAAPPPAARPTANGDRPPGHEGPPTPTVSAAESRTAFDELTALEAAVHALSGSNGTGSNGTGSGRNGSNGHTADGSSDLANALGLGRGGPSTNGHVLDGHSSDLHARNGHAPDLPVSDVHTEQTDRHVEDLDDLFRSDLGEAAAAAPPAPPVAPSSPPIAPPVARPAPSVADDTRAPERWSVLADVAELAEHRPAPPTFEPTVPIPEVAPEVAPTPPAQPPMESGIDLGNFTARGKSVGSGSKGRRRLFGR
jgi:hypothetical protein